MKLFNRVNKNSENSNLTGTNSTLQGILVLIALFGVYYFTIHRYVVVEIGSILASVAIQNSNHPANSLELVTASDSDYQSEYLGYSLRVQPSYITGSRESIIVTDSRIIAMRNFLIDYASPMYKDAEVFIEEADSTGLDWRLVASISGVESAFGRLIPVGSYNAWGWKGDPTQEWSHFGSWENGIKTVTDRLANGYGTSLTPFDIEPTYCPPCGLNPAHAWANGVTNYMYELDYYLEQVEEN